MGEAVRERPGADGAAPDWDALALEAISQRTAAQLVEDLAHRDTRFPAYFALDRLGRDALSEIRRGLKHDAWQVRRWTAALLDHHADDDALEDLVPLIDDPAPKVRLWAVHSLSCDRCKVGENPIDVVPHLLRRLETDTSIRVRRMAAAMLMENCTPDSRVIASLKRVIAKDEDPKLTAHARRALAIHEPADSGRG